MTARYVIVATRARDRWFDLDAVRTARRPETHRDGDPKQQTARDAGAVPITPMADRTYHAEGGAPPKDWYLDDGVTPAPKERHMLGHAQFLLGDVREQLRALIAKGVKVDACVTSPPFYNLRSYLDGDHPDKALEIGSEATPAEYLDTLLGLVALVDQVLAPHGSLVWELGDTYAGSGGAGGDYNPGGLRVGQQKFDGSSRRERASTHKYAGEWANPGYGDGFKGGNPGGPGFPMEKSLIGIPTLFAWSLAYGRNLLTGEPSPAGQWRIRNVIPWCRPNPPVGALGDKWRPATSYVVVACRARGRWFDLDAVRLPGSENTNARLARGVESRPTSGKKAENPNNNHGSMREIETNGAPPKDYFDEPWTDPAAEHSPDDGMWVIPTAPYKGAHYATWPPELVRRIVECMCPREVCRQCGKPRRRIVSEPEYEALRQPFREGQSWGDDVVGMSASKAPASRSTTTLGWTTCPCADYRPGLVLDPFVGSGTTMAVAVRHGRDAIGIDLDHRNIALARARMGNLPMEAPPMIDGWAADTLFGSPADEIEDVAL